MTSSIQSKPSRDVAIKSLEEHGVFTDILPNVKPSQLQGIVEIRYPSGVSVFTGATPHRDQVQEQPVVHFHSESKLDPNSRYTLIMTDPDLMKTNDPIDKQVRHWVQPGLTIAPGAEQLTASRPPHTSFLPSAPMPMTGPHRYVFILAKETRDIGKGDRDGNADFKERLQFVAQDFITENGLEVVGVAVMKVSPTAAAGVDDVKLMAESAKHLVTG